MYRELIGAIEDKDIGQLQALLQYHVSKEDASYALFEAARRGYTECVETLIPYADPKSNSSSALRAACQYQHEQVALMLLPHSNARASYSQALFLALSSNMTELSVALWPLSDTEHLYQMGGDGQYMDIKEKMPHIQALYEKKLLDQHMPDKQTTTKKKL